MAKQQVIVEMRYTQRLANLAFSTSPEVKLSASAVPEVTGVDFDQSFPPTPIPGRSVRPQFESVFDMSPYDLAVAPKESTYIVRAAVDEKKIDDLRAREEVIEVYSDPLIQPQIICPGSPALGTDADVERLLCAAEMGANGMDGTGVWVAIVDTGVNMDYLNSHGKNPMFDAARSWAPRAGLTPGDLPVGHGTMCAFDVCIAAPSCTILDIALLQSTTPGPTPMSGFLSDAVRAYRHLIDIMMAPRRPGEATSMVVNNSWGMFHPSWDFPPGNPGNYSDNPNHPFNRIVSDLERAGADILFAAGNCGADCPDGRCQGVTDNAIYGANGHPQVLCVAGVDTTKLRVGYSSIGPGRLTRNKPDISGYTHFRGSGVYAADGGTSAATPVVSGVVAAVRSKRPYDSSNPVTHPAAIRSLITSTAEDLGDTGYDFMHGYGVVNACELQRRFAPTTPIDEICRRYPSLCRRYPIIEICNRFPWFCDFLLRMGASPAGMGGAISGQFEDVGLESMMSAAAAQAGAQKPDMVETAYMLGYLHGSQSKSRAGGKPAEGQ